MRLQVQAEAIVQEADLVFATRPDTMYGSFRPGSTSSAGSSNSREMGGCSTIGRAPPFFFGCWGGGDARGSVSKLFCTTGKSAQAEKAILSNMRLPFW